MWGTIDVITQENNLVEMWLKMKYIQENNNFMWLNDWENQMCLG